MTVGARDVIRISLEIAELDRQIEQRAQELRELRERRKLLEGAVGSVLRDDVDLQSQIKEINDEAPPQEKGRRARTPLKDRIKAFFEETGAGTVTARDVADALGEPKRVDAIRTALYRLATKDHFLIKTGHGQYAVSPKPGGVA